MMYRIATYSITSIIKSIQINTFKESLKISIIIGLLIILIILTLSGIPPFPLFIFKLSLIESLIERKLFILLLGVIPPAILILIPYLRISFNSIILSTIKIKRKMPAPPIIILISIHFSYFLIFLK